MWGDSAHSTPLKYHWQSELQVMLLQRVVWPYGLAEWKAFITVEAHRRWKQRLVCCLPVNLQNLSPCRTMRGVDSLCREQRRNLQYKCKLRHKCSLSLLGVRGLHLVKQTEFVFFGKISCALAGRRTGLYLQNKSDEQATQSDWKLLRAIAETRFIRNSLECSAHRVPYRGPYLNFSYIS